MQLLDARRTIVIPNEMRVDTTAPTLTVESIEPTTFSPDGDGQADFVRTRFAVSERSNVSVVIDGEPAVRTPPRMQGKVEWYGKGKPVGLYELAVVADDLAGNRSQPTLAVVRLRFVALAPRRIVVPAGARFGVRVSTDALAYRWRLGARRGSSGRSCSSFVPRSAPGVTRSRSHTAVNGRDPGLRQSAEPRALDRQVEAERDQHERVREHEQDRHVEAVDEPAEAVSATPTASTVTTRRHWYGTG